MTDAAADAPQNVMVYATVIRADGTREDIGQIVGEYAKPLARLRWRLFGRPASIRRIRAANRNARKEQ